MSKNRTNKISYENATGEIGFTLKSDLMFHYVMQKSEPALIGLVCSLKGINTTDVKSIKVENPIDLNTMGKETAMDLKLTLNNNEILNVELQVYTDKYWIPRSLLYLCRAYDCIGTGDDYSKLKPTTHICITDRELFEDGDEFYSKYLLLNTKNYRPYTDKIGINVLSLNHTDNATDEDKSNNLVYWAELFKASTWEEFRALAKGNPVIEEVGNMILTLNTDNQAKELLEGQRRFREQMASQYAAGYTDAEEKYEPIISEKDAQLSDLQAAIKKKDDTIAESNAILADKDATIAANQSLISELQKKLAQYEK